jgi:prefoldin subunit 5
MPKKNGRPGRNPRIQEVQLKGMLQALNVTAEQLEKTNQVLTNEAAHVLEALWNGHQELVAQVGALQERLDELHPLSTDLEVEESKECEEN